MKYCLYSILYPVFLLFNLHVLDHNRSSHSNPKNNCMTLIYKCHWSDVMAS